MTNALDILQSRLRSDPRRWPDRHGEYHADCPWCGKVTKPHQTHFSIFRHKDSYACKCHVCGEGGGLKKLLRHLDIHDTPITASVRHQEPPKPKRWQSDPARYVQAFCEHPRRLQAWQAYKPLTIDSIARWRLGVGVLPSSRCQHRRLIVPVYETGQVIALHGRAYLPDDDDAKWLTSGGSRKNVLFNGDLLQSGRVVVICENMIDCILVMQQRSQWIAVASGGTAWRDEFTGQIAAARPAAVLVWLDNDDAGQKSADTIVPALCRAGLGVTRYQWALDAPPKADVGWVVMRGK
jgi:hypothetical protein